MLQWWILLNVFTNLILCLSRQIQKSTDYVFCREQRMNWHDNDPMKTFSGRMPMQHFLLFNREKKFVHFQLFDSIDCFLLWHFCCLLQHCTKVVDHCSWGPYNPLVSAPLHSLAATLCHAGTRDYRPTSHDCSQCPELYDSSNNVKLVFIAFSFYVWV